MGKVGKFIVGAILIVGGVVIGITTGNWALGLSIASTGAGIITRPSIPKDLASQQGAILQNRYGTQQGLPVVYGRARVGAILADIRVDTSSTKNKRLSVVAAWCHGSQNGSDISGMEFIYFGARTAVAVSTVSFPFSGTVPEGGTQFLVISHHLGSTSQVVDATLNSRFPTAWPTTSKGKGIAYTRLDMWFDSDLYSGGLPQIQAVVKGALVFDPRSSTTAWSDNPALCIRDYLTSPIYGLGVPTANLDDQSFIDMANYCDEIVVVPGLGSVKRYTCNGVVNTNNSVIDNLAKLCTSCRAQIINQGNKWRIVIRRQRSASGFILDKDNTVDGSWNFTLPGSEVPNVVRVSYVDRDGAGANTYQVDTTQWPAPGDTNPYLHSDSDFESRLEADLPFTDNKARAQQLAMTLLKEARVAATVTATLKETGLQLQIGDVIGVTQETPGWTNKLFDVVALLLQPDGGVQVILAEYNDLSYNLDAQSTPPSTPGTGLPDPFSMAAPTGLVLHSDDTDALTNPDGSKVLRIKMTWTAPTDPFLKYYEIQAKKSADSTWDSWGTVPVTDVQFFVGPVTAVSWDVRIRAVNQMEVHSAWVSGTITPGAIYTGSIQPSFNFSAPGAPATNNPLYTWGVIASPAPAVGLLSATDGTTFRDFLKADWGNDKLSLVAGATIVGDTDPGGSELLRVGGSLRVNTSIVAGGGNFTVDGSTAKWTFGSSGSLADADLGMAGNVGNLNVQARGPVTLIGRSNSASPGTTNSIVVIQAFTTATRTTFFLVREDGQMDLGLGPKWRISASGHLIAPTDNTVDIGASAATRPRTLYLGTSVVIGTDPGGSTAFRVGGSGFMNLSTGYLKLSGDGGQADRGGLLLNNSTTAVRHLKLVATFTGSPGTSSRARLGWVADSDLETFLNSGAAIEIGPANHVTIGPTLGTFDAANDGNGAPLDGQLLRYKGSTGRWSSATIQLNFNTGVMVAANLADGSAWTGANSNPSLSGTPTAPTQAPVVTAGYQCFIVDMSAYTLGATQVYVLDYAVNGGSYTTNAIVCTSPKIVWTDIPANSGFSSATTFTWKYKIRGASDSAYGPASSSASYSTVTNVFPFSLIVASQISAVNLAAIVADIGVIIAGRIQNTANDAGIRVSSGYTLPSTWNSYLDLPGKVFVVKDAQGSPVTRVQVGKVGGATTDYGVQIFDKDAATILDMTGAKRILAVPVQPSVDSGASLTIDLSTGLTQQVRLTNNAATITLQNPTNGARYRIWLQQDATGSRAFPTFKDATTSQNIVMFTNDAAPSLTTTPGAMDLFELEYRTSPTSRYTCSTLQASVLPPCPLVDSVTPTTVGTASTTHNISMPATVNAEELLLMLVAHSSSTTPTTPSGWTFIDGLASQGAASLHIYAKVAAGTEGGTTVNVATSDSTVAVAHVYRIHRWFHATSGVTDSSTNSAATTTPNPPNHTPGYTDRALWIAACVYPSNNTVSAYPTNYSSNQNNTTTTGLGIGSANRGGLYAASEDPGTFTISASQTWAAFTIAVRPPA